MNNKEITAEWARKTAETKLSAAAEKQLNFCLDEIKKAVNENKMNVGVYIYVMPACLNELIKRGFEVKSHEDQRDGTWTTISW
jgi:hypothetical protein